MGRTRDRQRRVLGFFFRGKREGEREQKGCEGGEVEGEVSLLLLAGRKLKETQS